MLFREESGKATPKNAAEILAEGEFNRYYARGVCRLAIDRGVSEVEIIRGRSSGTRSAESEAAIGKRKNAKQLLVAIRTNRGIPVDPDIPFRPGSGITIRLPLANDS
jgi:hypothetical protein